METPWEKNLKMSITWSKTQRFDELRVCSGVQKVRTKKSSRHSAACLDHFVVTLFYLHTRPSTNTKLQIIGIEARGVIKASRYRTELKLGSIRILEARSSSQTRSSTFSDVRNST